MRVELHLKKKNLARILYAAKMPFKNEVKEYVHIKELRKIKIHFYQVLTVRSAK
jgi:hypothetical protein